MTDPFIDLPGVTRLAIHRSFLKANTDLLKTHRDVMVKELAAKLAERGIRPSSKR
jgi:hypothetical protein